MENLNIYVKHREDFHPIALSAPAEKAPSFFDCTDNCRFMASVATLKDPVEGLERFTFNDRSVRLHTVEKEVNPRFWSLLHKFGEGTPAPVLVNTSFNLFGEPLVCDPRDAIRTYACSAIDALAMENYLLVKA
jgi:carbamoyltransferase